MEIKELLETHDEHILNLCVNCEKPTPLEFNKVANLSYCFRCDTYYQPKSYVPKARDK